MPKTSYLQVTKKTFYEKSILFSEIEGNTANQLFYIGKNVDKVTGREKTFYEDQCST